MTDPRTSSGISSSDVSQDELVGFWWQPISCSLQLLFNSFTNGKSGCRTIEAGSPYKGISRIRFRKVGVRQKEWWATMRRRDMDSEAGVESLLGDEKEIASGTTAGVEGSVTSAVLGNVRAQREQVRRQLVAAREGNNACVSSPGCRGGGLHVHAYTSGTPSSSAPTPTTNGNEAAHSGSFSHSKRKQHKNKTPNSNSGGATKNNRSNAGKEPPIFPVQVERYHLTCLQVGNLEWTSEKLMPSLCATEAIPVIKRGEKLKITGVVEEQEEVEYQLAKKERDRAGNRGDHGEGIRQGDKRGTGKRGDHHDMETTRETENNHKGGRRKANHLTITRDDHRNLGRTVNEEKGGDGCTTGTDDGEADKDGRMIYFLGEPSLGEGAEVELVVRFIAFVQHHANGGVFIADTTSFQSTAVGRGGEEGSAALLTHFEVHLARLAFPCPDLPVYRLWWTLENIQIPDYFAGGSTNHRARSAELVSSLTPFSSPSSSVGARSREYTSGYCCSTFFTNAPCKEKTVLPHQGAIQYRFASCGPLPAYLLTMAAFTHPLPVTWGFVPLRSPLPTSSSTFLLVRVLSTVPCDLQHIFTVTTDAVQRLQLLFGSPLPLLVEGVPDILWEEEEFKGNLHSPLPEEKNGVGPSFSYYSMLTVLVAPTMPYISGMEHHGLICVKDALYRTSQTSFSSSSSALDGPSTQGRREQDQLIVHEVAHHWIGNALGMPFSIKEGLCQWLELYMDKLFLPPLPPPSGRLADPGWQQQEKKKNDTEGKEKQQRGPGKASTRGGSGNSSSNSTEIFAGGVKNAAKRKEFTLHTYRDALEGIVQWSEMHGIDNIQSGLKALVQKHVVGRMRHAIEDGRGVGGGCGGLFTEEDPLTGSLWPSGPYLSASTVYSFFEN